MGNGIPSRVYGVSGGALRISCVTLALTALLGGSAEATPVTYTLSGFFAGSGDAAYDGEAFAISATLEHDAMPCAAGESFCAYDAAASFESAAPLPGDDTGVLVFANLAQDLVYIATDAFELFFFFPAAALTTASPLPQLLAGPVAGQWSSIDESGRPAVQGTVDFAMAEISVVPEPGTLLLVGSGLVGLGARRARSRRAARGSSPASAPVS